MRTSFIGTSLAMGWMSMDEFHGVINGNFDGSPFIAFIDKWNGDPAESWAENECRIQQEIFEWEMREKEIDDWWDQQWNPDVDDDGFIEIPGFIRVEFDHELEL